MSFELRGASDLRGHCVCHRRNGGRRLGRSADESAIQHQRGGRIREPGGCVLARQLHERGRIRSSSLHGGADRDVEFGGTGNDEFFGAKNNHGLLSAPVTTPDGTATTFGIQDYNAHAGDHDRIWS